MLTSWDPPHHSVAGSLGILFVIFRFWFSRLTQHHRKDKCFSSNLNEWPKHAQLLQFSPREQRFRTSDWPLQTSPSWMMVCLQTLQCLAFLKVFTRNVWEWRASNSSGYSEEKKERKRPQRWDVDVKILWPDGTSMNPGGEARFSFLVQVFNRNPFLTNRFILYT